MEFGKGDTALAATYTEGVCVAWAEEVENFFKSGVTVEQARTSATTHLDGRVRRHVLRGSDPLSARELRDEEGPLLDQKRAPQSVSASIGPPFRPKA